MGSILQSRHRLISSDSPNCKTQLQFSPGFLCEVGLSLVSNHSIGLAFITNLSNVKLLSWIVIWNGMPCHISLTNSNPDMRRKLQQSELICQLNAAICVRGWALICGHGNIEITVQLGATAPGANILEQAMSTQDVLKHGWCLLRETELNVSI